VVELEAIAAVFVIELGATAGEEIAATVVVVVVELEATYHRSRSRGGCRCWRMNESINHRGVELEYRTVEAIAGRQRRCADAGRHQIGSKFRSLRISHS